MPVSEELSKPRLDIDERRSEPPMLLIRVLPEVHLAAPFLRHGVDRLEAVRCLERSPEDREHAEPMKGQGILEPFIKARDRRLVDELELSADLLERISRFPPLDLWPFQPYRQCDGPPQRE